MFIFFSSAAAFAQQTYQDYQGNWTGKLPERHSFNFSITVEELNSDFYQLIISNEESRLVRKLKSASDDHICIPIDGQTYLSLFKETKGQNLTGFIKSGRFYYHIKLQKITEQLYEGVWNAFMVDEQLQSDDILLYVDHNDDETLSAYPFFGDQRFRGAWASDFNMKGDTLFFRDENTGFRYQAILMDHRIDLNMYFSDVHITQISLTKTELDWDPAVDFEGVSHQQSMETPPDLNDGWNTESAGNYNVDISELERMIADIQSGALVNVHSVLIAKENKLVFERYFDGFNASIPHDLRSASKSISSAMIGIAIEDGYLESVNQKLYDVIPGQYQYTKDTLKAEINLHHLLTMSSGLDVNNLASENYYQDPSNEKSWLKSVLEAPVVKTPGSYADYGSANPFLLGVSLSQALEIPLERYMDEKLFAPLGITNYINQSDDTESRPYFGGGMLLTPRDMLKFGQLYLNKGKWKGRQIISEEWVRVSFQKHVQLQDARDKNDYGYQWWHDTYTINGKFIESVEARGAGGQFIFILPELKSVVVITAGNFRNGKGNQSREILKEYILPAMVN